MPEIVTLLFLPLVAALAALPLLPRFGAPPGTLDGRRFRVFWGLWLVLWGAAALVLGSGAVVLDPQPLRMALLFGGQVTLGVALFVAVPALRAAIRAIPLDHLIAFQRCRVVGAAFILGAVMGVVSWPFAVIAAVGDVSVGVAAWRVGRRGAAVTRTDAARITTHGLADFAVAIGTALVTGAAIGWPFNLTPLFLVPIATLAHLAVIDRLRRAPDAPVLSGTPA